MAEASSCKFNVSIQKLSSTVHGCLCGLSTNASFTYSAFLAPRMHARPNTTNTCFIVELVALNAGSFLRYKVDQIKKFIIQILFVFK
ncbi:hypothetical protein NC651_015773 [Populus alba x Populus x berolinensis]|nr:hypothetical protein NC651_015773 [Populus alba x Populus x berolinensis]